MAGAGARAAAGARAGAGARADADARFGERLAREIEGVLGVGIAVNEVAVDGPGEGAGEGSGEGPATIHATCLVDGQARELVGTGDTLLEAARDLIRAAAELRLASAWWRLVGPS
jgi:hypothetical protein